MIDHMKAVWSFRHFWMSLVKMDLRQRYRRSVLGIGWSLLNPLMMSAVYCVVFSGLLGHDNWKAYAAYLLPGMAVWEFMRNSITIGCLSFIQNESYIRQCPLPCGIYPLRIVMGTTIHFLITLLVVLMIVVFLKASQDGLTTATLVSNGMAVFGMLAWILPAVVMAILFAWGVATLASFATIYFHDTKHIIEVWAQLWFFVTPIIYPRKILDEKNIGWLADLNPIYVFMELIRDPVVDLQRPEAFLFVKAGVLTVATVGLAFGTISWLQKKLIFQL